MGHSYNFSLVTSMKGAAIEACRVTGLTSDTCSVDDQGSSGLIESVTNPSLGTYTVQLTAPYPPRLITCHPYLSNADGTTDLRFASYVTDSYDPDAGTLTIVISNDDDSGAPVLADPGATDELHLLMIFARYTTV